MTSTFHDSGAANLCIGENKDGSHHAIKVNQFERVTYIHRGKEKKKLQLQDKMTSLRS